jgi:hypothetical protein
MRARSLVFAALGAAFLLGAAAPAFADPNDWRHHEEQDRRAQEWREHHQAQEWREHHAARERHDWGRRDWDRDNYAPPVIVAPPEGYYAPPPVYYNPGITFGFTVR